MSQQASCTFKMETAPVFLFAYIVGCALCTGLIVALTIFSPEFGHAKLPVVLQSIGYVIVFFGPPYAALLALVLAHYFKYTVTAEGIHGQDLLGRPVVVRWGDIAGMKPVRVGNLEFVRLLSASGARPVWLPTFVRYAAGADAESMDLAPQFQALHSFGIPVPVRANA